MYINTSTDTNLFALTENEKLTLLFEENVKNTALFIEMAFLRRKDSLYRNY